MAGNMQVAQVEEAGYTHTINPCPVSMKPHIQEAEDVEEDTVTLADLEKDVIRKTLEKYNGRRKNVANDLKISQRTLYRKMKEYDLL
jgi:transcriptional regulator with PAS, ATPase and Fis domain